MIFKLIIALILLPLTYVTAQTKSNSVPEIVESLGSNPNWLEVHAELYEQAPSTADSLLLVIQVEYYWKRKDYANYVPFFIKYVQMRKFLADPSKANIAAWRIFQSATDLNDLEIGMQWILGSLKMDPNNIYFQDTYANLLYKYGDRVRSANIEEAVVIASGATQAFVTTYWQILSGNPTWNYPARSSKINKATEKAAWKKVKKTLKTEFEANMIDSIVALSHMQVIKSRNDSAGYIRVLKEFVNRFHNSNSSFLNEHAWDMFLWSSNPFYLKTGLRWSELALKDKDSPYITDFMDTYANLLYKLGRVSEAIQWEQKAISHSEEIRKPIYEKTLNDMKAGIETW